MTNSRIVHKRTTPIFGSFSPIITGDLFDEILLKPSTSSQGGNLLIVSGYGTASMADQHMEKLSELRKNVSIKLILGMTRKDGIARAQHIALCNLSQNGAHGLSFNCRYVVHENAIHAKTYLWVDSTGESKIAFCGSANYTLTGFGGNQTEAMVQTHPHEIKNLFDFAYKASVNCVDSEELNLVKLTETGTNQKATKIESRQEVNLSLLSTRTGETHEKAGLNWGHRLRRNRDQAYIPIPMKIQRSNFFPALGDRFTVSTDDNHSFICVTAQEEGKAIQTTQDNSLLGKYFRERMGLRSGQYVNRSDLDRYGRTDVTFVKIDDETYFMDFSTT